LHFDISLSDFGIPLIFAFLVKVVKTAVYILYRQYFLSPIPDSNLLKEWLQYCDDFCVVILQQKILMCIMELARAVQAVADDTDADSRGFNGLTYMVPKHKQCSSLM